MSNDMQPGTTPGETAAEGTPSSVAVEQQDVNTSPEPSPEKSPDVKTAGSSPAEGTDVKQEKPVSMLDKVKQILSGKKEAAAAASPAESKEPDKSDKPDAGAKPEGEKPADEKAPDKDADLPREFAKHPAWQRILRERDTFKDQAANYTKIHTFLESNGISGHDAGEALKITALIYNDPQAAFEKVQKLYHDLGVTVGAILPADLKKDVEEGNISEERAKELSLTRVKANQAENRSEHVQKRQEVSDHQRELEDRGRMFDAWSDAKQKTDPDLAKKLPLMNGILLQMKVQNGEPRNQADVLNRLDLAHKQVTDQIRNLVPQKARVQPSPQNSGPGNVKTAPKTMLEAVQSRLSTTRRA